MENGLSTYIDEQIVSLISDTDVVNLLNRESTNIPLNLPIKCDSIFNDGQVSKRVEIIKRILSLDHLDSYLRSGEELDENFNTFKALYKGQKEKRNNKQVTIFINEETVPRRSNRPGKPSYKISNNF